MISLKTYSDIVKIHFNNPQNVGHFDENNPGVCTGRAGCADSGDCVRIQVKIREGMIEAICFKAQGSCATIAAASWLTSTALRQPVVQAVQISPETILTALQLPEIKKHCVLLALDALGKACKNDH